LRGSSYPVKICESGNQDKKGDFLAKAFRELPTNPSEEILHSIRQARNVTHHDMSAPSCQLFIMIAFFCVVSHSLHAQTPEPGNQTPAPGKPKEFIYVQKLVPRLYDGEKWTKEDNGALEQHFVRFNEAANSGQLILAGRTTEPNDKTFGIAIFRASDEAAARAFMKADPTVSAGLMTAELHPFALAFEQANSEPGKPNQFIYVLRLVPRLHDDKKWTKEDNAALERHIIRFQEATKSGQLILAGRTKEPGDKTFGIAIFSASDDTAAKKFMESDPAVAAKLMTAELHPFSVAVQRRAPESVKLKQ
jgi:uncharacterized protein YciI